MTTQITGYDPTGRPRIYAIHAPDSSIGEYIARAEADGWTGLIHERNVRPTTPAEEPDQDVPKRPTRRRKA